jgi:hypothetical protein
MTGRGKTRNPALAKWKRDALAGGHWRKVNTVAAIARLRRRLLNSMAHIARPRPADLARWQKWEADIADREARLAEMDGPAPPAFPPISPPDRGGLPKPSPRSRTYAKP